MDPVSLLLVLGLGGILFLQYSRVRRAQREVRATQAAVAVGSEVLTTSGMVATVVAVGETTVTLRSVDGHETRWVRAAVARVLTDTDPASVGYRPADGTTPGGTAAPTTPDDAPSASSGDTSAGPDGGTPRTQD